MRFGIIAAGYISSVNTRALMACEDVEIVAVANRTVSKAEVMCHELGLNCPIYSDWKLMLDAEKPDVAVINIYNDLHRECFLDCCARGIHVLVEKPAGVYTKQVREMNEEAKKHDVSTLSNA